MQPDLEDLLRYQYLKQHCVETCPGDHDGPSHPRLRFEWDIWNKHPEISPKDGLDSAIDLAMTKQRAKDLL